MSLIHGSCGLIYFVHEWQPRFNESALLDDVEMLGAVTRINARIHALAPVLNAPTQSDAVTVVSSDPDVPIASLVKSYRGDVYVFAVAMRPGTTEARFSLRPGAKAVRVEDIEEDRVVPLVDGAFTDTFADWQVRLYRLVMAEPSP